ncbi:unnamed protein product [Rodentolepis nana]|uniref:EGF-like domain-containing protein n=1 Tax=Rodentolepis nana TaxID=102285 RepID=A0A0R3TJC1_RODNA|nr:unnamed protein product [Rodentolepis nana]
MHDCSPSATCSSVGQSYECRCNRLYTDGGDLLKRLPGRVCYYSFRSGFFVGCLIILPATIAALALLFYYRRYKASRVWITPSNDASVSMQLVSEQHPIYSS